MKKVALDEAAKKYWKQLFKELGYGEELVKEISRRIKASFDKKTAAAASDNDVVSPIAHVAGANGGHVIEGVYANAKTRMLFVASIDKDGTVSGVKTVALRG